MAKTAKKEKAEKVVVYTPVGRLSFPYLHKPDTGRPESDGKYKTELYIPKIELQNSEDGKRLCAEVLKAGREFFNDKKLTLKDFKNPLHDMSNDQKAADWNKDCVRIRAKSSLEVPVIGPKKGTDGKFPRFDAERIAQIKGGDYARLICVIGTYTQQGGGVTLYLNFVQFVREGEAIGQGNWKAIENLSEVEVEAEDPSELVDTEESSDTDAAMVF